MEKEIIEELLEGVKELNGEFQSGWDDVIQRAEKFLNSKTDTSEIAVKFLEWTLINGWRKLDDIWEFSDGESHVTTKELFEIFKTEEKI